MTRPRLAPLDTLFLRCPVISLTKPIPSKVRKALVTVGNIEVLKAFYHNNESIPYDL